MVDDDKTHRAAEEHEAEGLVLVVAVGDLTKRYHFPMTRKIRIGRAGGNELVIDHSTVSRQHAELTTSPLSVRDLGSVNGVRVRGQKLSGGEVRRLEPGEAICVGDAIVVVQSTALRSVPRGSEQSFFASLANECKAALTEGRAITVGCVRELDEKQINALLPTGPKGEQLGEDWFFAMPEASAMRTVDSLSQRLPNVRIGVASLPVDATTAEQLLATAWHRSDRGQHSVDAQRTLIRQVASTDLSALVMGETGVGKELCAEAVHHLSKRSAGPFVKINCAAIAESLLESELFGYERGAFTGATAPKPGLIETANGGTVFLDEIGDMQRALQAKVLRVLEDRMIMRVGAVAPRQCDVRFVAATNRDLPSDIRAGLFRADLFYRLNGITISLAPLRHRDDIVALARAFAIAACAAVGSTVPMFGPGVDATLLSHGWPGNIRELRAVIGRAVLLASGGPILPEHLGLMDHTTAVVERVDPQDLDQAQTSIPVSVNPAGEPLRDEIARLEARRTAEALTACGGNQTRAARMLGISRNTLQSRMDQFGIPRPRK